MNIDNHSNIKKVVVKVSSSLLNPDNNVEMIERLSNEIKILKDKGYQVIVVTSGAAMYGLKKLNYDKKPESLPLLQSAAAIGQVTLMRNYQSIFDQNDLIVAQLLVSTDDFRIRNRYLNLRNTVESLLEIGAVPIFNENDTINTEELKFGDNDHLSALITIMVNFDLLVILSNVDGLYDKDPRYNNDAMLISSIEDFNNDHFKYAGSKISDFSTGGMKTKLESAYKATKAGIQVYIGNGYNASILKIIEKTETGTYLKGKVTSANARKKWLGLSPTSRGKIYVDEGASKALLNNSSLLASGIISVSGKFERGSLVNIVFSDNKIAQGLTNYSSNEIDLIKGKKSKEFDQYLETCDYKEIIHKNNLLLF